jgi:hypothetical protein
VWTRPAEVHDAPMTTLGTKPGLYVKPAPNHYKIYKWVSNPQLPPISLEDEPVSEADQVVDDVVLAE